MFRLLTIRLTSVCGPQIFCGIDSDFRASLAQAQKRLPPMQIGKAGQLQEWLYDWHLPVRYVSIGMCRISTVFFQVIR